LEQIKGINLQQAMEMFSGNEALYISILKEFVDECVDNLKEIEAGIDSNDIDKALAASHKLKGTASNISVSEVHKKAAILETTIRKAKKTTSDISSHEIKQTFKELNEVSAEFLESIQKINTDTIEN